jgi:hypothetical protein
MALYGTVPPFQDPEIPIDPGNMFLSFWGVTICYHTVKAFDRQPDESMASSKPTHLANVYEPNGDGFM